MKKRLFALVMLLLSSWSWEAYGQPILLGEDLSPNRRNALPPDTMQVVVFYDGVEDVPMSQHPLHGGAAEPAYKLGVATRQDDEGALASWSSRRTLYNEGAHTCHARTVYSTLTE